MLKIGDVSRILGVSTTTIRSWCNKGILKCHRLGSGIRVFDADEVMRMYFEYNKQHV